MPQIQPFNALRYAASAGNPGVLIAPPYDVLSGGKLAALRQEPHNIVHLTLPEGTPPTSYQNAAALFHQWCADGTLVEDGGPALYPYRQHFLHPATGQMMVRAGIMAAVRLHEFAERIILPHERTLSGPKADRLELTRATEAQLEPILGVVRDASGTIQQEILAAMAQAPVLDTVDSEGIRHEMWRVDAPEWIARMIAAFRDEQVVLIDGHHRYETALNYRRERGTSGNDPADFIVMNVSTVRDPGLVLLPTYRTLHGVPEFSFEGLVARLSPIAQLIPVQSVEDGLAKLHATTAYPCYLLHDRVQNVLVSFPATPSLDNRLTGVVPPALRSLDVTLLHDLIFDQLLGISQEDQAAQRYLRYTKSVEETLALDADPETQLAVFMNPTRLEQVFEVAAAGHVLPQKSTYFYPKLASGLLMRKLGG